MLKKTKDFRLDEWKKILTEVNSSGMSKRAWCRANGINERKLYYWQHLIWQTESTRRHLPAKQDLPVKSSGDMPDNGFVEVNLQSIRDPADCPASHQAGRSERSNAFYSPESRAECLRKPPVSKRSYSDVGGLTSVKGSMD